MRCLGHVKRMDEEKEEDETRPLSEETGESKLRWLGHVKRIDEEKSEDEIRTLSEETEESKLKWLGHVKRMDEERLAIRYSEWTPQGKRPVRRSRKRWIDCVEEALERKGTCQAEWRREGPTKTDPTGETS